MRSYLCASTTPNVLLNLIPILAIHLQSLTEPFVFLISPASVIDISKVTWATILVPIASFYLDSRFFILILRISQIGTGNEFRKVEIIVILTELFILLLWKFGFHFYIMRVKVSIFLLNLLIRILWLVMLCFGLFDARCRLRVLLLVEVSIFCAKRECLLLRFFQGFWDWSFREVCVEIWYRGGLVLVLSKLLIQVYQRHLLRGYRREVMSDSDGLVPNFLYDFSLH